MSFDGVNIPSAPEPPSTPRDLKEKHDYFMDSLIQILQSLQYRMTKLEELLDDPIGRDEQPVAI